MRRTFRRKTPLAKFIFFVSVLTSPAIGQQMIYKKFYGSSDYSHYCPWNTTYSKDNYAGAVRSGFKCAERCQKARNCVQFAFNSSNGGCFLYNFTPTQFRYYDDCAYMMDLNAFRPEDVAGCDKKALMKLEPTSCTNPITMNQRKNYYGCLSLTTILDQNGEVDRAVCLAPQAYSRWQVIENITIGAVVYPYPSINNWIILMQRCAGALDFNRNWNAYRDGFGAIQDGEFWIGNERIHRITSRQGFTYKLRIEVQLRVGGKWFSADYGLFSISNEANFYALNLKLFQGGSAGDSLINSTISSDYFHSGNQFSSPDKDRDRSRDNCADAYDGGWWFNYCYWSCLTCAYNTKDFSWYSLDHVEYYGHLRSARMMISA